MKRLAADNVVGEVENSRKTHLLIGGHFVQMESIQNTRLDLRGRFLRLGEFKERLGCVDKLRHKGRALLRGDDTPVNQTVDELLGNTLMHQILRRMPLATGFADRHQQPRKRIR